MADTKKEEPQLDMYLLFEGVKGPVTEPGREGWIKINSVQFGAGVGISMSGNRYRRRNQTPEEREAERKKKEEEEAAALERGETEEEAWARRTRSSMQVSSPSISELTLTKETDSTSPLLFHNTVLRKPARSATLEVVNSATKSVTSFHLRTIFISGFSFSSGRAGRVNESLSLNYQDVQFGVRSGDVETTARYELNEEKAYLNGELSKPFFEKKDDDDDY